eukprot:TRINITY_DN850_c0_g1_i1.p1 TRINITY_DN850_c0_g1~~TRINITY_DN850_c0_g1_i1.p1  ORF type:complete len:105 (+),score=9.98 TRINITY_DN850_c0_g1_i1:241-555(+)
MKDWEVEVVQIGITLPVFFSCSPVRVIGEVCRSVSDAIFLRLNEERRRSASEVFSMVEMSFCSFESTQLEIFAVTVMGVSFLCGFVELAFDPCSVVDWPSSLGT